MVDRKAPYSGIANLMALQGRMGDTELVHMSKPEIRGLQSLGEITINPDTGLPEAFNLKSIIPIVTTVAGGFFGGPAGAAAGSALGNFAVGERDVGNLAMNAALAYGIGTLAGAAASSNGLNAASAGFDSAGNVTQSSGIGFDYSLEGFVPPPNFTPSPLAAVPVASPPITAPTLPPVPVAEPSSLSKAFDLAKEYPKTTAIGAGVIGAGLMEGQEEPQQQLAYEEPIYKRKPEDQVSLEGGKQVAALTPEKYEQLYTQGGGTQEQITSLQSPFRYVPKSTYASHGGLIGLAEGGAVQRFLDNSGDVEETPSNSPSTSTPQSAQSSISNFDKARLGLTALGFVTGNPALTAISTAANLVSPLSTAISNLTDPNVAVFSSAVPGQVQSSPLGMFSDSAPQIAGMRADIAMDVDGPSGEDGAGSSGEDSEMGNDDPSMGMSDMKTGGLIGLANGGMVTVQPGDTLTKIANETGMTVEGLQSLNNITNRNMIKVGQQLKISEGDSGLDIASIKENSYGFCK
jgi:hypothetical protein